MPHPVNDDGLFVEVPLRLPLAMLDQLAWNVEQARWSAIDQIPRPKSNPARQQLATFARALQGIRARREIGLPGIAFGEPTWDMLLDLYIHSVGRNNISVSSLCTAAAVPQSTALRWIDTMVAQGHFVRLPDPNDGRRHYVSLSAALVDAMEAFLLDSRARLLSMLRS
jgi:DNA-binding MarR family transcriptional regulator